MYTACRNEAQTLCQADENWIVHKNHGQYIFACLARNLYEENENGDDIAINDHCADEIERILEQRAISVNLHPEIGKSYERFVHKRALLLKYQSQSKVIKVMLYVSLF